jgi:hypothetical protein
MLVYLNNFPRENAIKGQKFEGNKALEEELRGRGIIGEGEEVIVGVNKGSSLDEKIKALTEDKAKSEAKVTELTEANTALEAKVTELTGFIEEAITLPKGQVPEGYEKAE